MDASDLLFHHHHRQKQMAAFNTLLLILKFIQQILNIIQLDKNKVHTKVLKQFSITLLTQLKTPQNGVG